MRERKDKLHPNGAKTVESVVRSIRDNVTVEKLLQFLCPSASELAVAAADMAVQLPSSSSSAAAAAGAGASLGAASIEEAKLGTTCALMSSALGYAAARSDPPSVSGDAFRSEEGQ